MRTQSQSKSPYRLIKLIKYANNNTILPVTPTQLGISKNIWLLIDMDSIHTVILCIIILVLQQYSWSVTSSSFNLAPIFSPIFGMLMAYLFPFSFYFLICSVSMWVFMNFNHTEMAFIKIWFFFLILGFFFKFLLC